MKQNHDDRIGLFLEEGAAEGTYPGAALLVARDGKVVFQKEAGHLSSMPGSASVGRQTVFDLASLTKPLATTLALMRLVDRGKVDLDEPLSGLITGLSVKDKKEITLRLILSHSAGFADWRPFYLDLVKYRPEERKDLLRKWIVEEPLVYKPGKGSVYSDLGFMILEWIVEGLSGMALHESVEKYFYCPLSLNRIFLNTEPSSTRFSNDIYAATEDCLWRKRVIQGEVHDENAFALGGYSGHAGLFGDAQGAFTLVNMLREHYYGKRDDYLRPETVREFFRRQVIVNGCTWALGWDTPSLSDSSSGRYFSPNSVGHLGFAGTSVWMDLEKDVIVILLTNRVHPTRDNRKIKVFRPMLHDLIMEELGKD